MGAGVSQSLELIGIDLTKNYEVYLLIYRL